MASATAQRGQVIALYKQVIWYSLDWSSSTGDFCQIEENWSLTLSTVFSYISVDLPCPRLPEGPTAHAEEDTRRFHEEQVGDKFKLTKFAKRFFPPASRDLTDKSEIEQWIKKGEYIQGELEALYMLRKYRTMKNRYYDKD